MASGCNQPVADVCDSGLVATTSPCNNCLTLECCPEAEVCAGNPGCQKCLDVDAPPSCAPAYAPLAACKAARCPQACP
jgi:hypothetical protein